MKAGTNETVPEEGTPILQMERPLLPIDKYAAREGLTRAVVEECGRLGIVQLRRYKGKTYVVDVPMSPYHPACEGAAILQEIQNTAPQAHLTSDGQATLKSASDRQTINKTTPSQKISGSAQTENDSAYEIAGQPVLRLESQPATSIINPPKAETMSALAKSMFCKASKIKKQLIEKIKHETRPGEPVVKPQVTGNWLNGNWLNPPAEDKLPITNYKLPSWQVAAVSSMVCLFAAFLIGLWLYMNQRVHRSRLDRASASIQNVYDDSVRTSQQLATFQSKLVEFTAEFEWVKNELNNSKAETESVQTEIKSLRHEITKVRRDLEAIQQHNIAALEQLKEQFQQLTAQLSEFTKNNQTPSKWRGSAK